MKHKHKVLLNRLAQLTFEGDNKELKNRVRIAVDFLMRQYSRNSKTFLNQYWRYLKDVYTERYVTITCAGEFPSQWLRKLLTTERFASRNLEVMQDPSLLGGFMVRAGYTIFNYSLNGQLSSLRRRFAQ
jgi:F0F1-type ATP synthase delta subunit